MNGITIVSEFLGRWRQGIPLNDAWRTLASASELRLLNRMRNGEALLIQISSVIGDSIGSDETPELAKRKMALNRIYDVTRKLQSALLAKLENGSMVALGFTVANAEIPQIVSAALLTEKYARWQKNEFSGMNRRFTQVRIIPAWVEDPQASNNLPVIDQKLEKGDAGLAKSPIRQPRKTGRPPIDDVLRAIVRELKPSFQGQLVKQREDLVRQRAQELHPNLFPRSTQPSRAKIHEAFRSEGL